MAAVLACTRPELSVSNAMKWLVGGLGALLVSNAVVALRFGKSKRTLSKSVVVVTGASSGIGMEVARQMAALGARVVLVARRKDALDALAAEITKMHGPVAFVEAVNGADGNAVAAAAQRVELQLGLPDILINCAGAGRWRFLDEMDVDEVNLGVGAPYLSAAFWSRALVRKMVQRKRGSIINVQSPVCNLAIGGATSYCSQRWALRGLTESLAADTFRSGVRVHECVLGETSDTGYFQSDPESLPRMPLIARVILSPITVKRAGAQVVNTLLTGRRRYFHPLSLSMIITLQLFFPNLVRFFIQATGFTLAKQVRAAEKPDDKQD